MLRAGLDLTIIGSGAAVTGAVREADANSFIMKNQGGTQTALRRCTGKDSIDDDEIDAEERYMSGADRKNPTPSEAIHDATNHAWL